MSYDELKQQVVDKLIGAGFNLEGDTYVRVETKRTQVVINGHESVQEQKVYFRFSIIGEGAIDDKVTVGLNLKVNNADEGDFWIGQPSDLQTFFGIR